jgi:hypothetical protein
MQEDKLSETRRNARSSPTLSEVCTNPNRKPKKGDVVGIKGEQGAFVVVDSYRAMRLVDVKAVGAKPKELALRSVPWPSIVYLDVAKPSH